MSDMSVFLLAFMAAMLLFASGFYVMTYAGKKWQVAGGLSMLVSAALIAYGMFTHCNASVIHQAC